MDENETEETPKGILDKRPDDLTVRDTLKVQAGIAAVLVAVPVGISIVAGAVEAARKLRKERKALQAENESTESKTGSED